MISLITLVVIVGWNSQMLITPIARFGPYIMTNEMFPVGPQVPHDPPPHETRHHVRHVVKDFAVRTVIHFTISRISSARKSLLHRRVANLRSKQELRLSDNKCCSRRQPIQHFIISDY